MNLSKGLKAGSELIQTCKVRLAQAAWRQESFEASSEGLGFYSFFTSEEPLKVSEVLCCALFWITVAAELSTDSGANSTRPDGRAGLGCWPSGE